MTKEEDDKEDKEKKGLQRNRVASTEIERPFEVVWNTAQEIQVQSQQPQTCDRKSNIFSIYFYS